MQKSEVAMNHNGSDHSNSITSAIQQYPRQPPTNNETDANFVQMWILLAQLEEINIQFALLLDTIENLPQHPTISLAIN